MSFQKQTDPRRQRRNPDLESNFSDGYVHDNSFFLRRNVYRPSIGPRSQRKSISGGCHGDPFYLKRVKIRKNILAPTTDPILADGEIRGEDAKAPHGVWLMLAWFISLLIFISLPGFVISFALFFTFFITVLLGSVCKRSS